ncbi:hypothetical protein SUGI_1486330 [Cryptomeria japonica]|uniref:Uncharacterized protein n=1 Tax=Cryptomeria japonica TaxID=3369 RepID=A0AAD3NTU4_CRYJA|nr:hypothetical protein SUGI_1474210 [Cryptomeria japonica]GLJ58961.1 hypothetical protein SUGI_1486330 [Cryptomeria japonica]
MSGRMDVGTKQAMEGMLHAIVCIPLSNACIPPCVGAPTILWASVLFRVPEQTNAPNTLARRTATFGAGQVAIPLCSPCRICEFGGAAKTRNSGAGPILYSASTVGPLVGARANPVGSRDSIGSRPLLYNGNVDNEERQLTAGGLSFKRGVRVGAQSYSTIVLARLGGCGGNRIERAGVWELVISAGSGINIRNQ